MTRKKSPGIESRAPRWKRFISIFARFPSRSGDEVPGLEKGREDLIIAGAVVALNLLEVFGLETLMIVDSGLLEGILLDGLERMARSEEHGATR